MKPFGRALASRVAMWGSLVKFSHSVFALPFALIMLMVVSRSQAVGAETVLLLIACVVAARTAAMGFNRIVDREIDRRNPRTIGREIPQGRVSVGEAWALTIGSAAVFVVCAALLGEHCLVLAPAVLMLLFGYSLMKRLSSSCHFVLGLALACAPGGVWYALTGEWSTKPLSLMAAVLLWVSGFDILYSCQDREFDRAQGLKSIPAMLGLSGSVVVAASLHLCAVYLLALFGVSFALGAAYWVGLAAFALLLASQYASIFARGIACVDQVFFTRNGLASVALCVSVAVDSVTQVTFG
jgi:4-hydroxybenzoate polyprenyltransferase